MIYDAVNSMNTTGVNPYATAAFGAAEVRSSLLVPPTADRERYEEMMHQLRIRELELEARERGVTDLEGRLEGYRIGAADAERKRVQKVEEDEYLLQIKAEQIAEREAAICLREDQHNEISGCKTITISLNGIRHSIRFGAGETTDNLRESIRTVFCLPPRAQISLREQSIGDFVVVGYCSLGNGKDYDLVTDSGSADGFQYSPVSTYTLPVIPDKGRSPQRYSHLPGMDSYVGSEAVVASSVQKPVTALVIGLEYRGTADYLPGCCEALNNLLLACPRDLVSISCLSEHLDNAMPTYNRILSELGNLATSMRNPSNQKTILLFSGRGHPNTVIDHWGAQGSGETLKPLEGSAQPITDDVVFNLLARIPAVPGKYSPLLMVFDIGRVFLDLPYIIKTTLDGAIISQDIGGFPAMIPNLVTISVQYVLASGELSPPPRGGLLLTALSETCRMSPILPYTQLVSLLRERLIVMLPMDVTPVVLLGCSHKCDFMTELFSLWQ